MLAWKSSGLSAIRRRSLAAKVLPSEPKEGSWTASGGFYACIHLLSPTCRCVLVSQGARWRRVVGQLASVAALRTQKADYGRLAVQRAANRPTVHLDPPRGIGGSR